VKTILDKILNPNLDTKKNIVIDNSISKKNPIKKILDKILNPIKTILKKILNPSIVDNRISIVKFNRLRDIALLCSLIGMIILTLISFNYFIPLFPIVMGLLIGTIGIIALVILDKIIFVGDTIQGVSNNAVAVSITYISFTLFFICGFMFGNSYISNSYGTETESKNKGYYQEAQHPTKATNNDTSASGYDIELPLPESSRDPDREQ